MSALSPQTPPAPIVKTRRPSPEQFSMAVAGQLKKIMERKNVSSVRLAELSGLGSAELARLESGAETPRIEDIWRLANALGVPFGSLVAPHDRRGLSVIRRKDGGAIRSADGAFVTRTLFPWECGRSVEFYHITIGPQHTERAQAHVPGTRENLVVVQGSIEIVVGRESPVQLDEGDAIDFLADVPHSYRNLGVVPAALYLVMSYETGTGAINHAASTPGG